MQLKQLLNDDDAVSPVIGVILMVAITVILAAVIGTFVLGLGDQVQETSPNAQWNWDYDEANSQIQLAHEGGNSVDASTVSIVGDGLGNGDVTDVTNTGSNSLQTGEDFSDPIQAGDSAMLDTAASGEIRVVWTSSSGEQSSTMSQFEI